jgi:hypothetical protein
MEIVPTLWLVAGLIVATLAHEATHWLLASRQGLRLVGIRLTPIGVALTFPSLEETSYPAFQVATPALVTWIVLFGWLHGLRWPDGGGAVVGGVHLSPPSFLLMVTVVAGTMSAGDLHELVSQVACRPWWPWRMVPDAVRLVQVPQLSPITSTTRSRMDPS